MGNKRVTLICLMTVLPQFIFEIPSVSTSTLDLFVCFGNKPVRLSWFQLQIDMFFCPNALAYQDLSLSHNVNMTGYNQINT